jgi:hypothetical protein
MLDMYGLAALYFQAAAKNRRWNEEDALWFDPDGAFARFLALIRRAIAGRVADKPGEPVCGAGGRCAPAT